MTVYVDDMKASFKPKHRPGHTYVMSHMIGTDDAELHAMAQACGVARKWYQGDHYDVTQAVRAKAIRKGAVAISRRDLSAMAMLRRYGKPAGDPATAFDRLCAVHGITRGTASPAGGRCRDEEGAAVREDGSCMRCDAAQDEPCRLGQTVQKGAVA